MFQTTDALVASVKTRGLIPSSQNTFSDSDIINFLNEELNLSLIPMIVSVREDFFLKKKSVAVVSGQAEIGVPERAIGNALKQVFFVDASNNRRQIIKTDENIKRVLTPTSGTPEYFFFQGDEIVLVPTPNASSGYVEFYYLERPNQLVPVSSAAKITAISSVGGTTTFTVDTDLTSTFTSSAISAGTALADVLSGKSPFMLWSTDLAVTACTSSTIAVATSGVTGGGGSVEPVVNDYICVAQQTPIPMIPQELHPILAQMGSARIMEALGHTDKLQVVNAKLKDMMLAAFNMICNRVEDQPKRILNRTGLLAASGFRLGQNSFR